MGLPAAQQRVLDGIEVALRAGEPHLAAMYSIFTRLTGTESRPQREQLPYKAGLRSWPVRLRHALSVRRLHSSWRLARRVPGERNRFLVPRLLVLGPLMALLAVAGLLIGPGSSMTPVACTTRLGVHPAVAHARFVSCSEASVGK